MEPGYSGPMLITRSVIDSKGLPVGCLRFQLRDRQVNVMLSLHVRGTEMFVPMSLSAIQLDPVTGSFQLAMPKEQLLGDFLLTELAGSA